MFGETDGNLSGNSTEIGGKKFIKGSSQKGQRRVFKLAWFKPNRDHIGGRRAILVDGYMPSEERIVELQEECYAEGKINEKVPIEYHSDESLLVNMCFGIRNQFHRDVGDMPDQVVYPCYLFLTQLQEGLPKQKGLAYLNEITERPENLLDVDRARDERRDERRQLVITYEEDYCLHEDRCMRELVDRIDFEVKEIKDYVDYPAFKEYVEKVLDQFLITPFLNPSSVVEKELRSIGIRTVVGGEHLF